MDVAVKAASKIRGGLSGLAISLTDERYGPVGHANSNWRQLDERGFKAPGARLLPVLKGKSMPETAFAYQTMLLSEAKQADYSLALAGMGPDGHILGIKPGSPAMAATEYVSGYKWDDYDRLTPTIKFLKLLDEVVVYAAGQDKWPQFDALEQKISPGAQPAQLLKQLQKVIIFNDYKESKL